MFGCSTVCTPFPFLLFDDDVSYTNQIIDMIHLHVPRQTAEGRCDSLRGFRYMALRKYGIKKKL